MKSLLSLFGRYALTLCLVVVAGLIAWGMWQHYEHRPWTRDGRVRADVVRVSTDVGGLVSEVRVHDNQTVEPGQLLLVLDRPRLSASVSRADAAITEARAQLEQARKEAARDRALGELVAMEAREQNQARVRTLEAGLARALADRNVADIDLSRTEIRATAGGVVTNLDIHAGDYLAAGAQALALIDTSTLRIEGYFEETRLRRIAVGDRARIRLMGDETEITGHVESIAAAIANDQNADTHNLLPRVAPTFSWVRLAQRIPVRIHIDRVEPGVRLISGRSASIEILSRPDETTAVEARP